MRKKRKLGVNFFEVYSLEGSKYTLGELLKELSSINGLSERRNLPISDDKIIRLETIKFNEKTSLWEGEFLRLLDDSLITGSKSKLGYEASSLPDDKQIATTAVFLYCPTFHSILLEENGSISHKIVENFFSEKSINGQFQLGIKVKEDFFLQIDSFELVECFCVQLSGLNDLSVLDPENEKSEKELLILSERLRSPVIEIGAKMLRSPKKMRESKKANLDNSLNSEYLDKPSIIKFLKDVFNRNEKRGKVDKITVKGKKNFNYPSQTIDLIKHRMRESVEYECMDKIASYESKLELIYQAWQRNEESIKKMKKLDGSN